MKTIIAGGRDFKPTKDSWETLDKIHNDYPITEVVCGMARGADTFGMEWAVTNEVPVKKFPADWNRYGRSAGMIRNSDMADYADALIAFPGGRGTQNMIDKALRRKLHVTIVKGPYE